LTDEGSREMKVGDRVSKTIKLTKAEQNRGQRDTFFGTVAWVRGNRIGVAWDDRHGTVFAALITEIRKVA
jgi:hypothetical protein